MAQKPSIPKGTRDFSPVEMSKRNYIFDTIKSVFTLHGFHQIETPAMENLSTLMGKYGDEGDKLLFKILNSGDFLSNVNDEQLAERNSTKLMRSIAEKGLRYDLTVPFARFVVQHQNEIKFPFKRFQIQPVWRADRPQRGRYREFYQCDADVIGTDSLLNEVDLLQIIDEVFCRFGINIAIKLNDRKVLSGIAETIGEPDKIVDITVAIDKIDKIGIDNVNAELLDKGISQKAVEQLQPVLTLSGSNEDKLNSLATLLANSEVGMKGIEELRFVMNKTNEIGVKATIDLDPSLARGLNYYTGTIIEVKALDVEIGSITGGGRYDNLTGVCISFGADRIYDVLNQLDLYPEATRTTTKVLFVNFGEAEATASLKHIKKLRASGISAEIFPESSKMRKQMGYANDNGIPFVAIIGETELANGTIMLTDMNLGTQQPLTIDEVIEKLK